MTKKDRIIKLQRELITVLINLTMDFDYPEILSEEDDKRIKKRMDESDLLCDQLSQLESEPDIDLAEMSLNKELVVQKFCNELESILKHVKLKNYRTDEGDAYPLVDLLSAQIDNTISSGLDEINNIVEQVYFNINELSIFNQIKKQSEPTERKTAEDYPLIPMFEITDEARQIAVAWMECEDRDWIGQKHKLASDIMNYARNFASQSLPEISDEEIEKEADIQFGDTTIIPETAFYSGAHWAIETIKSRI